MSQLNTHEKNILNIIRKFQKSQNGKKFNKNDIASALGIQWTTVSNTLTSLSERQMVELSVNTNDITLNDKYEFYAGISIGSSRIKVVLLDFCFNYVNRGYINEQQFKPYKKFMDDHMDIIEDSSDEVRFCLNLNIAKDNLSRNSATFILNDLCEMFLDMKSSGLNIGAIGFTFPGIIDSKNNIILSSYVFGNTNNIGLCDLIDEDTFKKFNSLFTNDNDENESTYVFDQNSNAAAIAEKEIGCLNNKNAAVIYGSYGYGISLILDNKLHSKGGQLGHMIVIPNHKKVDETPPCRCGQINCLENRINNDVFDQKPGKEGELKTRNVNELCSILEQSDDKREILSDYLAQAIYNIVQLTGVEDIVFTGKLSYIYPYISRELKSALLSKNITSGFLKNSEFGEYSGAVGIAIEAYYKKFNIPLEWRY